jgi:hypothetical protein
MLSTPREQGIGGIRSGPGLVEIKLNYNSDITAVEVYYSREVPSLAYGTRTYRVVWVRTAKS